jgi:hypothetical protein
MDPPRMRRLEGKNERKKFEKLVQTKLERQKLNDRRDDNANSNPINHDWDKLREVLRITAEEIIKQRSRKSRKSHWQG